MAETVKHFTLKGHYVTGSVCGCGRGLHESQLALYRLYPTVISGGTWVYYSWLWWSDNSDYKKKGSFSFLAAVFNCNDPEIYLLILSVYHFSMHRILSFLLPNILKRMKISIQFIVLVTQSVRWAFPEFLCTSCPPHPSCPKSLASPRPATKSTPALYSQCDCSIILKNDQRI